MSKRDDSVGRWWDESWTLVRGCTWPEGEMPPACERCWARSMARRFRKEDLEGVRTLPENLSIPLKRRKPTVWACQIQYGDLFHPEVPGSFIARVPLNLCPGHTFVFLTKRPERAAGMVSDCWNRYGNAILLVSVWDQASTDRACAAFAKLPPGMKWGLHMEPLLWPVSLHNPANCHGHHDCPPACNCGEPHYCDGRICGMQVNGPSWIVVGGESGPGSRPLHPDWVRTIRDQCSSAGVKFYFKGWGDWLDPRQEPPGVPSYEDCPAWGGPGELLRVGKKHSGRLLDGREHNEVPWC